MHLTLPFLQTVKRYCFQPVCGEMYNVKFIFTSTFCAGFLHSNEKGEKGKIPKNKKPRESKEIKQKK